MIDGYGCLTINNSNYKAHQIAFVLSTHTSILPKMGLCHHCDNPKCVNPDHLFVGTQRDNLADMVEKGRANRSPRTWGENNPKAKLTESDVRKIRALLRDGLSQRSIARMFSVTKCPIQMIRQGLAWRHVA
jgi:hypothetical protein